MPAVGQGVGKLCPPSATARDPAFRSGHFQPIVPFLFGSHEWNITFANKLTCPAANFAKGSWINRIDRMNYQEILFILPIHVSG